MSDITCLLPECATPATRKRLCHLHYQRAYRAGTLDDLLAQYPRPCKECGAALGPRMQANRAFCSDACANRSFRRTQDPSERRRRHKEWRDATADRRREKFLASRPDKACAECGMPLPIDRGNKRRFCDMKCGNAWSLREHRHIRLESTRVRQRKLVGPGVSEADWIRLCNRFAGRCAYCGVRAKLTLDHVVPVSRGGQHSIGNILPACGGCNSRKRARFITEWRLGRSARRPTDFPLIPAGSPTAGDQLPVQ